MKNTFVLILFIFLSDSFVFSQPSFISHNLTYGSSPGKICLADFDGDNDLDILAIFVDDNLVAWYENDGTGYFDSINVIDYVESLREGVCASDINNDGKIDVVIGGGSDVRWYQNPGNGNFGPAQIINNTPDMVCSVFANDLDNDSLIDVISSSNYDSTLVWNKNLGNGNFGPQQIISINAPWVKSIYAEDLDLDGNTDIVYTLRTYKKIVWKKNLGGGFFGPEQIVTDTTDLAFHVMVNYIDNDSLPDIIYSKGGRVSWLKNLGNGNFSTENIINDSLMVSYYFYPADFDNDNDLDMVMPRPNVDSLVWQENLGNGNFGPRQLISNTIDGPYGVCAGDLDGDGYMDIVAGAEYASSIEVYLNRETGGFDLNQVIAYSVDQAMNVFATDLNNDGRKDVLSASRDDNKIAWYKNMGNKEFSLQKVISDSVKWAYTVYAADLDNDGFNDVMRGGQGTDTLAWFSNMQNETFSAPITIQGTFGATKDIMAKDLDNDSLLDVIFEENESIYCLKNLGAGNLGPPQLIGSVLSGANFDVDDINGDGYLDVVFADGGGQVRSALNNSLGGFLAAQSISSSLGARDLKLTDLNNDGHKDILFLVFDFFGTYTSFIGWYQNDGLGNFAPYTLISTIVGSGNSIVATDIDNDGDEDIFSPTNIFTGYGIEKIVWFENLGSGNFSQAQYIDFALPFIWGMMAIDLDNDFDNDIILSQYHQNIVKWLENTLNNLIDTIQICPSDSALIFGTWQSQPGNYFDTLQNVLGGDSINIIKLETYQTYFYADTVDICEGETYNYYGQVLSAAGLYSETLQSIYGCDSIEELSLVVIPAPVVSISPFTPDSVSINAGLLALPTATPVGGTYSGIGVTANAFDPALAGLGQFWISYSVVDTATGCTGQDSTLLKVYDPIGIDELETNIVKLYPNPGTGNFILTGTNLQSISIKTLTGELVKEVEIKNRSEVHFNLTGQAKGIYFVHIVNDDAEIRRLLILM
ncbi:MAG: T9SS type A sorting domain-containing protein [Bacteroidales bacterium]|nr:T9SS type A sorting domain-containing protein [Bacteroidales bacterium]